MQKEHFLSLNWHPVYGASLCSPIMNLPAATQSEHKATDIYASQQGILKAFCWYETW